MKTAKEIVQKFLEELQKQHHNNIAQVSEGAARLGDPNSFHNIGSVEMYVTASQISQAYLNGTASLREAMKLDLPQEPVMEMVEAARKAAVDSLIRAHAHPMGAPGDGWQVSHHIKAAADARIAQGCEWLLKEIAKLDEQMAEEAAESCA